MPELRMSEAAVLEKAVRQGVDVVVEHDGQPVAVLRSALAPRRKTSAVLALMPKDSAATADGDFARDLHAGIKIHREPLEAPTWD
jgi:antitoxin (DNA-binding transcriptional repressor) of toxin-antitoxin stability system